MTEVDEILDELCSGRLALVEAAAALERMRIGGVVDDAQLQQSIDRCVDDGRLEPDSAISLVRKLARPSLVNDATVLRPAAATGRQSGAMAARPSPPDTSGSSSSGWRRWAATEGSATKIGVGSVLRERFVIEELVGEGGMGLVFRARDRRREEARDRNPYVAIKVLGDDFKSHPDALISLQREARRMQLLSHPNIASVYDFDRDGSHVYLVMELLEGEALDRILEQRGKAGLPLEEARKVLQGVGSALQHAHSRGLVHSDFKPANVFVTRGGEVKVIDFGIARIAKDSTAIGNAGQTVFDAGKLGAWTNAYASPEQMLDGATPDPRDDIYALGLVAYEALTGRHPFGRKSSVEARFRNMTLEPVAGLTVRQNEVLAAALNFDREKRLVDPMELARSLTAEADDAAVQTPRIGRTRSAVPEEPASPSRRKWRTVALAIAGVAWLGFFASYWMAKHRPSVPEGAADSATAAPAETAPTTPALPAPVAEAIPGVAPQAESPRPGTTSRPVTTSSEMPKAVSSNQVAESKKRRVSDKAAAEASAGDVPAVTAAAEAQPEKPALYRWVDSSGKTQFGDKPPPEYADSAVKIVDY